MVECVEDILSELGPLYTLQESLAPEGTKAIIGAAEMPAGQQEIFSMIGYEAASVDMLVEHSGLPVARVMAALSTLELQGKICRFSGGYIHC
jgi:predicted Rossmann fold nucleotide-binding protein DprA/Smf involved in DNA uptake